MCLSVNTITPEPLEISSRNFQGIILMVERADKFENGSIAVRGWWFNVSDVLVSCLHEGVFACVYVFRQDVGRMRSELVESVVPYLNAARQIVADSCQLVTIFICVLVLVDLLSAVVWIYLRRSVFAKTSITTAIKLATSSATLAALISIQMFVYIAG